MSVVVKAKGATVPSAEEVEAREGRDRRRVGEGEGARGDEAACLGTVAVGVGGKDDDPRLPADVLTVKAGTTVTFVNRAPSEPHNVAFGPLKYIEKFMKETDLFPMGPNAKNQVTPVFVYGTDPRGTPHDGTTTATGSTSRRCVTASPGGLPNSFRITFTKPGKYHFICLLHGPDMAADIVVTK